MSWRAAIVRRVTGRHRVVRLVVGVAFAVGAVALVGLTGRDSESTEAADALAALLARGSEPSHYEFEHRAGGTTVLDCVMPNRRFSGAVDLEAARMAITVAGSGRPGLVVTDDGAWVDRSLLAPDVVSTRWVSLDADAPDQDREAVRQALGGDLGGYAAPGALAPSGNATAAAALEVASDVVSLGRDRIGGAEVVGFRVSVDPDRYRQESGAPLDPGGSGSAVVPRLDVWVDREGFVRQVEVRAVGLDGRDQGAELGWSVVYHDTPVDVPAPPAPTEVTPIEQVDASRLTSPSGEPCELDVGS